MTSPLQQKIKVTGPVVVTGNRLTDGAVIYRATNGQWTTELPGAAVVTTSDAAMDLLTASRADAVRVVDIYVAPVVLADGKPRPGNLRERIRAAGPTIALPALVEAGDVHVCA
jgi:Protein of unknown function (DUF2849)